MRRRTKKIQNKKKRPEFTSPSKSKDSKQVYFTRENGRAAASSQGKMNRRRQKAETAQVEATDTWIKGAECSGSSSKVSPQPQKEVSQEKTTFVVLQKNTRSMNSTERLEELLNEVHQNGLGCDIDLRDLAPKQRGMGNATRSPNGGIREIHQQTWSRDLTEKNGKVRSIGYSLHVNV